MRRTNLFNPFQTHPQEHENRLTWAFLVTLRYEPAVQMLFRDLVHSQIGDRLPDLEVVAHPPEVLTQQTHLGRDAGVIVSVLLTDEQPSEIPQIEWTNRKAVYDGIVYYDDLILIIENKLCHRSDWRKQVCPSLDSVADDSSNFELRPHLVVITWAELLESMVRLQASRVLSYAGDRMVGDLMEFVGETHPKLSPYRTFSLCEGREAALRKRCASLVNDLALAHKLQVDAHPDGIPFVHRPGAIAQEARLDVRMLAEGSWELWQELWPGDTVDQARRFYRQVDRDKFLALVNSGWRVQPNLHFSFMATQLVSAMVPALPPSQFFAIFQENSDSYGRRPTAPIERLEAGIKKWLDENLINTTDAEEIREKFMRTKRQHINVIPGFRLTRTWPANEVMGLEKFHKLRDELTRSYEEALSTWSETMQDVS